MRPASCFARSAAPAFSANSTTAPSRTFATRICPLQGVPMLWIASLSCCSRAARASKRPAVPVREASTSPSWLPSLPEAEVRPSLELDVCE